MKLKVLYVCHGHPSVRPGGAEGYALELYQGMRQSDDFEPILLARNAPGTSGPRPHPGTPFSMVNGDPNQYFVHTGAPDFDLFYMTLKHKGIYGLCFNEFLKALAPDVVHFQHTMFLGYDLIRQTRNTLGDVPMLYTLHEYLPICHRTGQMVRTVGDELCSQPSPRRCSECFPEFSPQDFFMRKRFIQSHFSLIDQFLAPSRFLLEKYIEWGIPPERIRFEPYGRQAVSRAVDPPPNRPRNRLGYFGQINAFKGVDVLLEAMSIVARAQCRASDNGAGQTKAHLWLHGANLDLQPAAFQHKLRSLIAASRGNVTVCGPYDNADLPKLMANVDWAVVPSTWWENSPLVIDEAFMHGRPVICSGIGGMAEKVRHGVDGIHFRAGDPADLARSIQQAVDTPDLWERLREGIPEVYAMPQHVERLGELYQALFKQRTANGKAP